MKTRAARWILARRLVGLTFLGLFVAAVLGAFDWFLGSPRMTRSFDVLPLVDPLVALEYALAGGGLALDVLLGAGLLLLVAAVLGPVFCGWICPLGQLLDWNQALRNFVVSRWRRRQRRRHPDRPPAKRPAPRPTWRGMRYALLGLLVGFVLVSGLPVFASLSPINLAVEALATGALVATVVTATIVVVEWFAPRLWCRSLCPLGALYSTVGRLAPWRVRINPQLAGKTPCQLCTRNCTMGIRVMEDYTLAGASAIDDPACTRCGSCLDSCPTRVLSLRFRDVRPPADGASAPDCDGRPATELQPSSSAS